MGKRGVSKTFLHCSPSCFQASRGVFGQLAVQSLHRDLGCVLWSGGTQVGTEGSECGHATWGGSDPGVVTAQFKLPWTTSARIPPMVGLKRVNHSQRQWFVTSLKLLSTGEGQGQPCLQVGACLPLGVQGVSIKINKCSPPEKGSCAGGKEDCLVSTASKMNRVGCFSPHKYLSE